MPATPSPLKVISSPTRQRGAIYWILAAVFAGCVLAALYTIAEWKLPVAAAQGGPINGQADVIIPVPRRFRVATFNVHGGYGADRRRDLNRTAAALGNNLDFVGMNEVHGGTWTDPRSNAEQLGALLNRNWLFAPIEVTVAGREFGQGMITRLPVSGWRRVPFPRVVGNGYRNYVECQIPLELGNSFKQLTVLVTHLDRKSDRQDQLRVIIKRFLEVPAPAILMGDLNSKRTELQLVRLAKEPGVIDCFGKHATGDLVQRRIDWIFARGLHCLTSNLESTDASDHPWGWAELELPK